MKMLLEMLSVTVLGSALVFPGTICGADDIGTVSSFGPFTLSGNPVPAPGQSLPLTSGDEIVTGDAPATILLNDRSSLTAEPKSHIWTDRQGARTVLCLSQGGVHFNAAASAQILVCAQGRPVKLEPLSEGTVTIEIPDRVHAVATTGAVRIDQGGSCACSGMPASVAKSWSGKTKALVVMGVAGAAGAATAVGLGVAREEKPTPVSPSRP